MTGCELYNDARRPPPVDFDTCSLQMFMVRPEFKSVVNLTYLGRRKIHDWEECLDEIRDTLGAIGLACFEHPHYPYAVVAFPRETVHTSPPCIVFSDPHTGPELSSEVDTYIAGSLIQLVHRGVIDVAYMAGESEDTTDWTEAEDPALLD